MKLYPNLRNAIYQIISNITEKKQVLDHSLQALFKKNKQWGARDRRAIAQCSYDMVRHYEFLKHISNGSDLIDTYISLLNEKNEWDFEKIVKQHADLDFNTLYSVPKNFLKSDIISEISDFNQNWAAMHRAAPIFLRVNTSQADFGSFIETLKERDIHNFRTIEQVKVGENTFNLNAIALEKPIGKNHTLFTEFDNQFEIQDIGSQILTEWLGKLEGNVIEGCAGNGGKTTHLLDRNHSIRLVSMDLSAEKIVHLKKRVNRMFGKKVTAMEAKPENIANYYNWADYLLLDVPCSGLGTLRRQPCIAYRISKAAILEKVAVQRKVILQYLSTLRENGKIFYSTCSLHPAENELQAQWFDNIGFKVEKSIYLYPKEYEGDGFFGAIYSRK